MRVVADPGHVSSVDGVFLVGQKGAGSTTTTAFQQIGRVEYNILAERELIAVRYPTHHPGVFAHYALL